MLVSLIFSSSYHNRIVVLYFGWMFISLLLFTGELLIR